MVVGHQVEVPDDVLPLELHIHGPGVEVHLALDLAGDDTLLRGVSGFVSRAGLEVALVL
ncbi:hypothetical protein D3C76_1536410 [compost metagenome]